jgi:hypothetical protein
MIETAYGTFDKTSLLLYNEELCSRTFGLLYLYEQQPFKTYQVRVHDLIIAVKTFQKIKLHLHPKFNDYIENLAVIIEPKPLPIETEHDFVKRHILNAVNILCRIIEDVRKAVDYGEVEQ